MLSRLVGKIFDAAVAPEAWPEALDSLCAAVNVAGAACFVSSKKTGRVEWACCSGLGAETENRYIGYYARLDPFTPLVNVTPGWTKLSESLPDRVLRRSEWYNDFVLHCGVRDILGTLLVDTPTHAVLFGVHQQIGRSFAEKIPPILDNATDALAVAARRHVENLFGQPLDEPEPQVTAATRYYFHIFNGRRYPDETGTLFSTPSEALAHAVRLAAELAQDDDWDGFAIRIARDDGSTLAEIPVRL